jgi:hypothetical protein
MAWIGIVAVRSYRDVAGVITVFDVRIERWALMIRRKLEQTNVYNFPGSPEVS